MFTGFSWLINNVTLLAVSTWKVDILFFFLFTTLLIKPNLCALDPLYFCGLQNFQLYSLELIQYSELVRKSKFNVELHAICSWQKNDATWLQCVVLSTTKRHYEEVQCTKTLHIVQYDDLFPVKGYNVEQCTLGFHSNTGKNCYDCYSEDLHTLDHSEYRPLVSFPNTHTPSRRGGGVRTARSPRLSASLSLTFLVLPCPQPPIVSPCPRMFLALFKHLKIGLRTWGFTPTTQ